MEKLYNNIIKVWDYPNDAFIENKQNGKIIRERRLAQKNEKEEDKEMEKRINK